MQLRNWNISFLVCATMSFNSSASEVVHIVKFGDTISSILFDLDLKPIYGKRGLLKETLRLNPKVNNRKDFKIFPGEKIKISLANNLANNLVKKEEKNELTNQNNSLSQKQETPPSALVIIDPPKNSRLLSQVAQAAQVEPADSQEQYIFVRVAPQVSWMKVLSSNSTAFQTSQVNALSKASPGFLGTFGVNVSDNFNLQTFTYLSEVHFYQDAKYNLSKNSFLRQAYGLGGEYRLDPKNRFSLRAGFFDEFYLTMNNTTTINIETAQIPEVHWGYRHILGQYKNVTFDSGIFGKFIIPYSASSIDGQFGYGLGGDFLLMFKNKGLRFFYNYSDAKALNKSTKTFELGWNIVFEGRMYE